MERACKAGSGLPDSKVDLVAERAEQRPQPLVLGAEPLELARRRVEPRLQIASGHGCEGQAL